MQPAHPSTVSDQHQCFSLPVKYNSYTCNMSNFTTLAIPSSLTAWIECMSGSESAKLVFSRQCPYEDGWNVDIKIALDLVKFHLTILIRKHNHEVKLKSKTNDMHWCKSNTCFLSTGVTLITFKYGM